MTKKEVMLHVLLLVKASKYGYTCLHKNPNTMWIITFLNKCVIMTEDSLVVRKGKNVAKILKASEPLMSGQVRLHKQMLACSSTDWRKERPTTQDYSKHMKHKLRCCPLMSRSRGRSFHPLDVPRHFRAKKEKAKNVIRNNFGGRRILGGRSIT